MFCEYCGKSIDDKSKFCPFCGRSCNPDDNTQYKVDKFYWQGRKNVPTSEKIGRALGIAFFIFLVIVILIFA